MATFANLTAEQRDVYSTFERDLRAFCGAFQRLCNAGVALNTRYTAQVLTILAALDDNTVAPNASGLAGSSALDSDAELATLVSHLQTLLTTLNTTGHQELRAKACGSANAGV